MAGFVRPLGGQWRSSLLAAADALGVPNDGALQEAIDAAAAGATDGRPAPFAPAQVFALIRRALTPNAGRPPLSGRGGEGELIAAWLADFVLAQRLKWPFALPLLAAPQFPGGGRRAGGDLAHGAETARIQFGYARAAAQACDLAAELGRRAQKLQDAAPKLGAKGAPATLQALLDEDSLSASGWDLHPLESAAFSRRTRGAVIPCRFQVQLGPCEEFNPDMENSSL